eukprot:CAMPEP_0119358390 /NCGR_PEP_ID=MMETSP1334-20130426/6611_1 /TAXON_ID=127549 /ORGANISM="Calcidiscus leptoporus, Strain RCC1130" /LENGTH=225 /DNA_ID=CAMNT_0007372877 /DNA_START=85 /DNA_END=759 /DNA_ORIENTATION=+
MLILLTPTTISALLLSGHVAPRAPARTLERARARSPRAYAHDEPIALGEPCSGGLLERAGVKLVAIPEQKTFGGRPFPLTLAPHTPRASGDTQPARAGVALASWGAQNQRLLVQLLCTHGAVLLRGWAPRSTADDFSSFVCSLGLEGFGMGCSAAPRTNVAPGVFTANEAPPSELIPFHHEMAQCDDRPAFLMFFCEKAPAEGGATPIIPSDAVAAYLHARHPRL